MIILKNLDNPILTLEGGGIASIGGKKSLTYRSALISIAELHRPVNPGSGEGLKAFDLGIRLLKAKGSIELEDPEMQLLKKMIDGSSVFLSVVIGRLLHYLEDSENKKVEEKTK